MQKAQVHTQSFSIPVLLLHYGTQKSNVKSLTFPLYQLTDFSQTDEGPFRTMSTRCFFFFFTVLTVRLQKVRNLVRFNAFHLISKGGRKGGNRNTRLKAWEQKRVSESMTVPAESATFHLKRILTSAPCLLKEDEWEQKRKPERNSYSEEWNFSECQGYPNKHCNFR